MVDLLVLFWIWRNCILIKRWIDITVDALDHGGPISIPPKIKLTKQCKRSLHKFAVAFYLFVSLSGISKWRVGIKHNLWPAMSVLALTAMFRDPLGVIAIYRSDECLSVVFPLIVFSNVLFNLKRRIPQMEAALDQQVTPSIGLCTENRSSNTLKVWWYD